jgi:hypothetical protein
MALVVIPFKFVRRLALQEYLIDVRHSSMSTMRTSGISLNAHRKKKAQKKKEKKKAHNRSTLAQVNVLSMKKIRYFPKLLFGRFDVHHAQIRHFPHRALKKSTKKERKEKSV